MHRGPGRQAAPRISTITGCLFLRSPVGWCGRPSLMGNLALGPTRAPLPGSKLREGSIDLNTPLRRTRTQAQVANTKQKNGVVLARWGWTKAPFPFGSNSRPLSHQKDAWTRAKSNETWPNRRPAQPRQQKACAPREKLPFCMPALQAACSPPSKRNMAVKPQRQPAFPGLRNDARARRWPGKHSG